MMCSPGVGQHGGIQIWIATCARTIGRGDSVDVVSELVVSLLVQGGGEESEILPLAVILGIEERELRIRAGVKKPGQQEAAGKNEAGNRDRGQVIAKPRRQGLHGSDNCSETDYLEEECSVRWGDFTLEIGDADCVSTPPSFLPFIFRRGARTGLYATAEVTGRAH